MPFCFFSVTPLNGTWETSTLFAPSDQRACAIVKLLAHVNNVHVKGVAH
jgi:hypothetical protein